MVTQLVKHRRKLPGSLSRASNIGSVHETAFLSIMPVEICEENYFVLSAERGHQLLSVIDFRVDKSIRVRPASVQIIPTQGCSGVSNGDAIRVKHGNDDYNEVLPYVLTSLGIRFTEFFHEAFHDIT